MQKTKHETTNTFKLAALTVVTAFSAILIACAQPSPEPQPETSLEMNSIQDKPVIEDKKPVTPVEPESDPAPTGPEPTSAEELREALNIIEDYRPSFEHGEKAAEFQKYIMLHDTEGDADPQSVINWWDSNGNLVAAHFIVGTDGTIAQCVPLDKIAHHAGFGDTGHNQEYGVDDESRDDKLGTVSIGDWAADYGMNSYSVGIEMVHIGGSGHYPKEQLDAVDSLIAYIDAYYGFESEIIDHKAWRTGNSDTSPEFSEYLESYRALRKHTAE